MRPAVAVGENLTLLKIACFKGSDPRMSKLPIDVGDAFVVPLSAEEAEVHVRKVERGRVRVTVQTAFRDQAIDQTLTDERVEVTRVPLNRVVAAVPPVRDEGDTTIISIVEEVMVVQRRLVLKEEIHLRRVRTTTQHTEVVALREQHAVVERLDDMPGASMTDEDALIPQTDEKNL